MAVFCDESFSNEYPVGWVHGHGLQGPAPLRLHGRSSCRRWTIWYELPPPATLVVRGWPGGACWRPRNVTGWWRGCGRCARNLLCEVITPESAPDTLELARRHGRPELKAFSLDYMSSPGVLLVLCGLTRFWLLNNSSYLFSVRNENPAKDESCRRASRTHACPPRISSSTAAAALH
jgi:hypothetical protein